jgi:hypothetical protein
LPPPPKQSAEEFYEAYQDAEVYGYDKEEAEEVKRDEEYEEEKEEKEEEEEEEEELELRDVVVPATEALGFELSDVRSGGGFRAVVVSVQDSSAAWRAGVRANDEVSGGASVWRSGPEPKFSDKNSS